MQADRPDAILPVDDDAVAAEAGQGLPLGEVLRAEIEAADAAGGGEVGVPEAAAGIDPDAVRAGALRRHRIALHLAGGRVELAEVIAGQLDPVDAAAVLDDAVRRDVDVLGVLDPQLLRAALEVGIPAVHADDGVRAVARHPDDARFGAAREDAVDAAARRRAVREQAPRSAVQLVLDVDRLGQRLLVADERIELEVARRRIPARSWRSGSR